MRKCSRCGKMRAEKEFSKSGNKKRSWCKKCCVEYNATYRREHPKATKTGQVRYNERQGRIMEWMHHGISVHWTRPMIDKLIKSYACSKTEDLAIELGVSRTTVYRKAKQLGLDKSPEWRQQYIASNVQKMHTMNRALGYPGRIKKGQHLSPATEFKKKDIA